MLGSIIFLQIDFLIVIEKFTFAFYESLYSMKYSLFVGGHTYVYKFSYGKKKISPPLFWTLAMGLWKTM